MLLFHNEKEEIEDLRRKIFLTGYKGGMVHLASCFSCVEMLYAFYCKGILKLNKKDAKWRDRDRFVLSKGHAGLALYAVLMKAGYISEELFNSYLIGDSAIGGEPCSRDCEWIESATGSLGHGLSVGLGMAIALKMDDSPAKVYVMLGDGELEEGTVWEALLVAPKFEVTNLIVIIDCNKIQKMNYIDNIIGPPEWKKKLESFGWIVDEVDGHDVDAFTECILNEEDLDRPRIVIANTIKGKGVSIMENNPNWHFKTPKGRELKVFMDELGINEAELR